MKKNICYTAGFASFCRFRTVKLISTSTLNIGLLMLTLVILNVKSRMVMLIDDDKDDCEIFCDAANQVSECKCHCVHNAMDALTILDKTQKLPACIFLDINMPVMDGVTVLTHIKRNPRLSKIPVVMYSTTSNPKEAEKCLTLGADRFIRKTTDYRKLISSLREIKSELIDTH
jgi:CheY-like chemotaxis protein